MYHSGVRTFRWDAWLRWALVGASVTWAAVLPLTAFAASRIHAPSIVYAGAAAAYMTGSFVCHQLPERSYHLWGAQLPVCARCLGIYLGGAASALAAAVAIARTRRSTELRRDARAALAAAAVPTIATLAYEWICGEVPENGIRAIAGVPLGAVVAWLVVRQAHGSVVSADRADG